MAKRDQLSIHLLKVLDQHVRNIPYYSRLVGGEEKLPKNYGSYVEQLTRIDEANRIIKAAEEAFNELEPRKKSLISLYYFEDKEPTLGASAELSEFSKSGAGRAKKDYLWLIARKLGWI
ncbi:hypothetical protein H9649_12010 [Sporosarcina sp. Sa2YVA2]|uniref:ArpU family transcriptional regulator n=1 Tax=Sporosarcina quadrami TaxID=2762234 RepID=A0ABR8UBA9_9BACL|nr:hypothetical protein [Sporosarcina quadrami]MBD7985314.1 hypothetical protein [Sporosarcina quadrami]